MVFMCEYILTMNELIVRLLGYKNEFSDLQRFGFRVFLMFLFFITRICCDKQQSLDITDNGR